VLKINLLPAYIYAKRKVRRVAFVFGVLFLGVVAGLLAWWMMLGNQEARLKVELAEMDQRAKEVEALEQQVKAEEAKIPPIQSKVTFIEDVLAYNLEFPKIYEELARYTYSRIMYQSVDASTSQLTIRARARSVGDCGRYLLNMYRAGHLFSGVTIDSVPGWPSQGEGGQGSPFGFDFNVTCTLAKPITEPAYGGAGGEAAGEGVPTGISGTPGGMPQEGPMPDLPPPST
jgi:Tfp pilus assembly protein PilN